MYTYSCISYSSTVLSYTCGVLLIFSLQRRPLLLALRHTDEWPLTACFSAASGLLATNPFLIPLKPWPLTGRGFSKGLTGLLLLLSALTHVSHEGVDIVPDGAGQECTVAILPIYFNP